MNGKLRTIAIDIFQAVDNLSEIEKELQGLKRELLELSLYSLEIFDLNKGEKPESDEEVPVWDEENKEWYGGCEFRVHTGEYFAYHGQMLSPLSRFHRWTRLPKLKEGK